MRRRKRTNQIKNLEYPQVDTKDKINDPKRKTI